MKKITLIAGALLFSVASFAQITLTQNDDPVTIDGGITCDNAAPSGITGWRTYNLDEFGIENDFVVSSVEWAPSSLLGAVDYEVVLTLWTADDFDILTADLTEIASETVILQEGDEADGLISTPFVANIPAGSQLVFSVALPDDGVTMPSLGSNGSAQNSPSYANGSCLADITDIADFGLTNAFVMNVVGDDVILNVDDNTLSQVSIFPNPATDVVNVKVPSSVEILSVSVYDILGKKANVTAVNGQVNVAELAAGVYLMSVETTAGTLTEKVIKN